MALIPPFFIDTVIAIGKQVGTGKATRKQWTGTGFIYATFQNVNAENPSKSDYKVHLVTNKHVLQNQEKIIIRFNPQNGQAAKDFPIPLKKPDGSFIWTGHPNAKVDVAVIRLNVRTLIKAGMKFSYFKFVQKGKRFPRILHYSSTVYGMFYLVPKISAKIMRTS